MSIEETNIRILRFLAKTKNKEVVPRTRIIYRLNMNHEDLSTSIYSLSRDEYVNFTESEVNITPKGRDYLEKVSLAELNDINKHIHTDYNFALLKYLYSKKSPVAFEDFPEVFIKNVENYGNLPTGNFAQKLFDLQKYIDESNHRYVLNSNGLNYFELLNTQSSHNEQSEPPISDFSESEIKMLNAKIDQLLEDVKALKLEHEIIWTDLMQELNELKQLYFLNKKNWRQLLIGKVSEMVVSGVISESLSKKIVDVVNPIVSNLLR